MTRILVSSQPLMPVAAGCILLLVALSTRADPGIWSVEGPEGGSIHDLAADPVTPNYFYALGHTAVFRSTDGGVTWTERSTGITTQLRGRLAHSRTSAGTLFAMGSRKLFHTNNGGMSWQDRSPALPPDASFQSIALSPTLSGRVYLARLDHQVLRSDDNGLSWTTLAALPTTLFLSVIAAHPSDADRALAAGIDNGSGDLRLYRTVNAGASWAEITCGGTCPWTGATGQNRPQDLQYAGFSGDVFLTTPDTTYKSTDFGTNWTTLGVHLGQRLSVNPSNSNEVLGTGLGVAYTTDGGATVDHDRDTFPGNATAVSESTALVHNPFNPNIVLAGTPVNGVYRRTTPPMGGSGGTWVRSDDGIRAQLIRAIAVAPGGFRVHAGVSDVFSPGEPVAVSTDAGATWTYTATPDTQHLRALVIDPNDNNILYAGGHKLAATAIGGGIDPANGGLYKSTDAGVSWTTIDTGIPLNGTPDPFNSHFGTVRSIALDTTSALGGTGPLQTLYAGGTGRLRDDMGTTVTEAARIYKSTDAGATWAAADNGLGEVEIVDGLDAHASVVQLIHNPGDATGQSLYAGTFITNCCWIGATLPTLDNGVFATSDGGANWTHISSGLPHVDDDPTASHQNVLSLALDPTDVTGNTLYASVNDPTGSHLGSIYKTTDGGASWSFSGLGLEDRDVRDLIVDPVTGDLYAAAVDPLSLGDGGVFASHDGGASWIAVGPGFPPGEIALKLTLDRSGPNPVLYAGTGRSLQSIEFVPDDDSDGASDAAEGEAPNGGDGDGNGIPDAQESDVASLVRNPFADGPPRLGTTPYNTIAMTPVTGACPGLERVESVPSSGPAGLPAAPGHSLPGGVIRFRIADCDEVDIELIFHDLTFGDDFKLLAYLPDAGDRFSWQPVANATVNGNTWTLRLTDGDAADVTPAGDGVILFQGGPATLAEAFFRDGFEP